MERLILVMESDDDVCIGDETPLTVASAKFVLTSCWKRKQTKTWTTSFCDTLTDICF